MRGQVPDEVVQAELGVATVGEGAGEGRGQEAGEGGDEGGEVVEGWSMTEETCEDHHWAVSCRLTPS